jgi:DDE superfamily endonuclease
MLQLQTLPPSLAGLLWAFRSCFTAPSFRTFTALVAGMIAQPGRRTVCGMLTGAGLAGIWHHARAHRFFAQARWDPAAVGLILLHLVVDRLVPTDAPILLAVDDTLLRRSGRRVAAAGWFHDGSTKTRNRQTRVAWGNCWIVAGIIVRLPMLDRPICLPVAATLCATNHARKQALACTLISRIAAALPGRTIHVVADGWYAGMDGAPTVRKTAAGRGLPTGVTLTSRPRANSAFRAIADPPMNKRGRPQRIGPRLGTAKAIAATLTWHHTQVHRYGTTTAIDIAERTLLWYGVYRSRTVRLILLRDTPETGHTPKTGYHLALISTDLTTPATELIERYAARWSIEVAFEDAKQTTGIGQARNRTPTAVARTVPLGLYTQTLVTLWYTDHGHHPAIITTRRSTAPWYRDKTQPSYHDMINTLRRTLIAARILRTSPAQLTPEEIHTLRLAWTEATT